MTFSELDSAYVVDFVPELPGESSSWFVSVDEHEHSVVSLEQPSPGLSPGLDTGDSHRRHTARRSEDRVDLAFGDPDDRLRSESSGVVEPRLVAGYGRVLSVSLVDVVLDAPEPDRAAERPLGVGPQIRDSELAAVLFMPCDGVLHVPESEPLDSGSLEQTPLFEIRLGGTSR